ncbi:hypothetical protein L665_02668 [Ralstonia solanacearum SD54]|nr:hypothetical protein F504_500 [Ralstonia pseudosolanacearum FQY_4]ANH34323.1 hypothetical protein A3768_3200 [Ralstonia solanacearum]ESS48342.1 hypothetical protein L665_02668 [Ralstonia solanacearum SD54]
MKDELHIAQRCGVLTHLGLLGCAARRPLGVRCHVRFGKTESVC